MPQVKKASINNRILEAAFSLFWEKGYQATSMPDIASRAGTAPGNVYRYYKSKFELFYVVLEPWLNEQLDGLESQLAALEDGPEKIRKTLVFMWIELPRAGNNFMMNLMEALATKKPDEPYSRHLLHKSQRRIARLMDGSLPPDARRLLMSIELAHVVFMAHDGFTLNVRLAEETGRIEELIDGLVALIFRSDSPPASDSRPGDASVFG